MDWPGSYDWHDGHSVHHAQDLAAPQLPGLAKADAPGVHPHMDAPPVNDQAAGIGVSTYKQFALPYGDVKTGSKPDLRHYNYHGKLPEIQKLVADHGFKTYYAGGGYGKPDLANKNYNTGHLMVYDPSPSSGGDFGHENYTNAWRQIHELSHALTLPELNKTYGEGRRMGKLGVHRTTHEALRAVHWEWLAAHKQRDLSKQIGVSFKDEDFHKELNTVLHDAVHRAVTGKFTEPSGEGFTPHTHKVPLHTALQMVRDAGHQMGLTGMHDLIKKPAVIFSKTEGEKPVADEKMYSPEEARDVLVKSTREKVEAFAKEIELLRTRELRKSLIPNHKHSQGSQASAGEEDVPPGKINPKGVDKSMSKEELCKGCGKSHEINKCGEMEKGPTKKAEDMDKAVEKIVVHGDKKPAPKPPPGADYTSRKEGDKTVHEAKKSELVDGKGKKKDNHTVSGSKTPEDKKSVHVNKPGKSSETAGSGGVILPGSKLKKSATPPTAKPPGGGTPANPPTSAPKAPKAPMTKALGDPNPNAGSRAGQTKPGIKRAALNAAPAAPPQATGLARVGAVGQQPISPTSMSAPTAKLPGATSNLKSPKAAGVTGAGPNKAQPIGIFAKLKGKLTGNQ